MFLDASAHLLRLSVAFHIPSRPVGSAYSCEGTYLMRVGENLFPMSEDQLRRIFSEGQVDFLHRYAYTNADHDKVVQLLDTQSFFDLLKRPYPTTRESVLERLKEERLVDGDGDVWHITNLGALLFGKNLQNFGELRRKGARVIVYKGINKLETLREQIGGKGYAVGFEGLIEYINGQLPSNEVIGQALRTEARMYPELAIRELVANALIHQDMEDFGSFVMTEIYSDRIEISNPGRPLIDTDRFIDEYKSRNEQMTDLMRRLGICEEKSSGVDKVITLAEDWQLPAPDFRATSNRTSVVLFTHKAFEDMDRSERVRACYQHACLCYVNNQKMTNQSLRERFKLPSRKTDVVSKIIADAVAAEKIKSDDSESSSKRYAKYAPYWA